MSIGLPDRKILWGRAGNRCAFPDCRQELIRPGAAASTVVGEEAHIVAKEPGGPRGASSLSASERDGYSNLILLCPTHHTIVDKSVADYPVGSLQEMKSTHETWVAVQLGVTAPTTNDILYAEVIQGWQDRTIDSQWWLRLLPDCFEPRTIVQLSDLRAAKESYKWILSRCLPGTLDAFDAEFKRFELVFSNFVGVLNRILEPIDGTDGWLHHRPYYKDFRDLETQWDWVEGVISDLALELVRCANALIEAVIAEFEGLFRRTEGVCTLNLSDFMSEKLLRPLYQPTDRRFLDLRTFLDDRTTRDYNVGVGHHESGEVVIGLSVTKFEAG